MPTNTGDLDAAGTGASYRVQLYLCKYAYGVMYLDKKLSFVLVKCCMYLLTTTLFHVKIILFSHVNHKIIAVHPFDRRKKLDFFLFIVLQ